MPNSSEAIFKKLIEHMSEGLWIGDKNHNTVYVSPRLCHILGYSEKELLQKNSYDYFDKEDALKIQHIDDSLRKKGISSSYEANLVAKDGTKIPMLISGAPLPDGGTIAISLDLREIKQKGESEKILSSAIQHASDAIIIFDTDSVIKSWNNGAKLIFGYKKEEMINQKLDKLLSLDQIANFFKHKSGFYNFELKSISKNARKLNISATLTTILNGDKKSPYYLLIARDITNQIQFEEELASKYEKIKEAYNKFGLMRRQMDYVFEILCLLDSSYDRKSIADYIVSSLIMLTRADACVLRIYEKTKNTLELISCFGVDDWHGKAIIKYQDSLAQKAYEKRSSLKIIDLSMESRYQSPYHAKKNNLHALFLIPLRFQNEFIGSLSLYITPEKDVTLFDNPFIEQYAKMIEVALYTVFFKK